MSSLTIEGRTFGARRALFPSFTIPTPPRWADPGATPTLRELITGIVTEQVAAYNARRAENSLVRVLTETQIEAAAARGKVVMGNPEALPAEANAESSIAIALQAFEDGLYFVFVDDHQYEGLDQTVRMRPDSKVVFLRLVALAGG